LLLLRVSLLLLCSCCMFVMQFGFEGGEERHCLKGACAGLRSQS
jgi:hypothetical protein